MVLGGSILVRFIPTIARRVYSVHDVVIEQNPVLLFLHLLGASVLQSLRSIMAE